MPSSASPSRRTRRRGSVASATVVAAAVAASTLLVGAAPAAAADFSFELPAGQGCDFALRVDGTGGRNHTRTFVDSDGNPVRVVTAGTGSALTFVNASTGARLALRSNGAVSWTDIRADGTTTTTATGHIVLILFPSDVPAGPSTTLHVGRLVFDVATDGVFTVRSVSGRTQDICAALTG